MRILLIEDDAMIGAGLCQALERVAMTVDWVKTAADAAPALAPGEHALVLLDLGLPDGDGLQLLRAHRASRGALPIIIITARDSLDARIAGLDLGADDYVLKPFETSELLARIRAVMRRHAGSASPMLAAGELTLDLASHEARFQGAKVLLPAREFALLRALCARPGMIFSRAQLEAAIYGWGEEVESNAIDVLIYAIRQKLGRSAIRNVRGAGWMVTKDMA
ncbi:MAG: response regulator [Hyphomicrobiales bacterium]|nr:response regulator [Hyphomicrobiales bacterium]